MSGDVTRQSGEFQLLTSPGPAAIAVVRVCGPPVGTFLDRHVRTRSGCSAASWAVGRVFRAELLDEKGLQIDDMLVSLHAPAPDWEVRLHLHGSPGVVNCCKELLRRAGFLERSESVSTLWHSENSIQAEMHARLPRMLTRRSVEWLVRQSRLLAATLKTLAESSDVDAARRTCCEIAGRRRIFDWFAHPLRVALVGPANTGKSTLANALADQHASLVSPVPGTTRDWLEIPGEIDGFPVLWLDTAGLRSAGNEIEAEGIRRTRKLIASADAVLLVLDVAAREFGELAADRQTLRPVCVALNKCDLVGAEANGADELPTDWQHLAVRISAAKRTGLDTLTRRLIEGAGYDSAELSAPAAFTNRQATALEEAARANAADFSTVLLKCLSVSGPD